MGRALLLLAPVLAAWAGGCSGPPGPPVPATCAEDRERCPLITEIMAASQDVIEDEDGDRPDWLEIHNRSDERITLLGWFLTDDEDELDKWRIPDATIEPNGFLVVFASHKDRRGEELHTGFKLSRNGEYLALVEPDGRSVAAELRFPKQYDDVSYGLGFDGHTVQPDRRLYFDEPTPGRPNRGGAPTVAEAPIFSRPAGPFSGMISVTVTAPAGEVHYTTDGSKPDAGSPLATGPIPVDATTTVRARALGPGLVPSEVVQATYVAVADDVASFSSDIPFFILDSEGADFRPDTFLTALMTLQTPGPDGRSHMTAEPALQNRGIARIRGSSSTDFWKKSFAIETEDADGDDMDVEMLGMPADSDWALHAPSADKTFMRNHLAFLWSRAIGRWAARTAFVEVFVNQDGDRVQASDYEGLYVLMERVKRGDQRVNIQALRSDDDEEPEITGGYILSRDRPPPEGRGFVTMAGNPLNFIDPKLDEVTDVQRAWIESYLNAFEGVLAGPGFADPATGYAAYIDVDSFIDHHLLTELTRNVDGLRLSTFMYKDRGGKLVMGPIWDCNQCFGNVNYDDGWMTSGWHHARFAGDPEPASWRCECPSTECGLAEDMCTPTWWRRLWDDPAFRERYRERWMMHRAGPWQTDRLMQDVDDAAAIIMEAQERNFVRWPILGVRLNPNWYVGATFQDEIDWMKGWIQARAEWMDSAIMTAE